MSSNNYILISHPDDYLVQDVDAENEFVVKTITTTEKLEDAIMEANLYMEENPVEYGMQIRI